jgi:hypothetical protein
MKYLTLTAFAILWGGCFAQKTVLVTPAFQPNTSYNVSIANRDSSIINLSGSEATLNRLKANERPSRDTMRTEDEHKIKVIMGSRRPDGGMPIQMVFYRVASINTYGGLTKTLTEPEANLFGGYDSEMIISIDSIVGENLTDNVRQKIRARIEANNNAKFPKNPIRIGESFEQKIPVKLPLDGGMEAELILTIVFRLKEIKNNKAFFDTKCLMTAGAKKEGQAFTVPPVAPEQQNTT